MKRYLVVRVMYYQLTFDGGQEEVTNEYEVTFKELAVLMGSHEAADSLVTSGSYGPWRLI